MLSPSLPITTFCGIFTSETPFQWENWPQTLFSWATSCKTHPSPVQPFPKLAKLKLQPNHRRSIGPRLLCLCGVPFQIQIYHKFITVDEGQFGSGTPKYSWFGVRGPHFGSNIRQNQRNRGPRPAVVWYASHLN